jgi:hypothetical protein
MRKNDIPRGKTSLLILQHFFIKGKQALPNLRAKNALSLILTAFFQALEYHLGADHCHIFRYDALVSGFGSQS